MNPAIEQKTEYLLVLTNLPSAESAEKMAAALVTEKLAACVNILPAATSVYEWRGKLERANEWVLLIKTPASGYAALETAIRARHPYELPEIIAVPISHALPEYLKWISTQCSAPHYTR